MISGCFSSIRTWHDDKYVFFVFSTTIHGAEHAVFPHFLGDMCRVNGDPNHVWSPSSFSGPLKFFSPPKFAGWQQRVGQFQRTGGKEPIIRAGRGAGRRCLELR